MQRGNERHLLVLARHGWIRDLHQIHRLSVLRFTALLQREHPGFCCAQYFSVVSPSSKLMRWIGSFHGCATQRTNGNEE
jgi:hypothetical protein